MIIAPDISYYQKKVDNSFDRQWLIFRACDGSFLDPNASFNADWCRGAVAQGRMVGWTAYVVYRPGMNGAILQNLIKLGGPWDRFMVDIESWSGAIKGDHSAEINSLIQDLGAIAGPVKVWRYGNQGDLASIHPHPLAGQLTVVASYSATRPNVANLVGWQFTNGVENHTANPSSTPPFGACDHNELYVDELSPSGGGVIIGGNVTQPDPNDPMFLQYQSQIDTNTFTALQKFDALIQAQSTTNQLLSQLIGVVQAIPAGPAGAPGPAGPAGPAGASGTFDISLTGKATPEASA